MACGQCSDEITEIPELPGMVDIEGEIVTIDAMGTRKAIADRIVAGGANNMLALQGNQGTLHRAVIASIDERLEGEIPGRCERNVVERGHGREESRTCLQRSVPDGLPGRGERMGLKSLGGVTLRHIQGGEEAVEVRYDMSSLEVEVDRFARAARSH